MNCSVCNKGMPYNPPLTFLSISYFEMMWGEQSIYPFEKEKTIFCSSECANIYLKMKIEKEKG